MQDVTRWGLSGRCRKLEAGAQEAGTEEGEAGKGPGANSGLMRLESRGSEGRRGRGCPAAGHQAGRGVARFDPLWSCHLEKWGCALRRPRSCFR